MRITLKKLEDQVIVITGASSGIGLATARMAARKGAKVALSSRNEEELRQAVEEIRAEGGEATYFVADVADKMAVQHVADHAIETYGRFDTWVNNAGLSIYGKLTEVEMSEKRRLFDVNFWGVVHGCRAAVPHLWEHGGAIINIGSIVSERAVPLQGIYAASKAAVKNYTDALRMELEEENSPISVTLIKPATIDTPFFEHARSKMEVLPKAPAPVYAPEAVAEAILHCASHARRELTVGGGGKLLTFLGAVAPSLTDRFMEGSMRQAAPAESDPMFSGRKSDRPSPLGREGNLERPRSDGSERGSYPGHVMRRSLMTETVMHPAFSATIFGLIGAGVALFLSRGRSAPNARGQEPGQPPQLRVVEEEIDLYNDWAA